VGRGLTKLEPGARTPATSAGQDGRDREATIDATR
jgi:hypothetical protein